MFGIILFVQTCVICTIADILIFLCVDKLCKVLLGNCRTLSEKRDIWLFESLTIFGLSAIVFAYHHAPVLLWLLGFVTFISATLTGRIDFIFYWESLKNYWNEFSDQEESMRVLEGVYAGPNNGSEAAYRNQVSEDQRKEYLRQSGDIQISNENAVGTSSIGEGLKTLKYNEQKAKYELVVPPSSHSTKFSKSAVQNMKNNLNVRRRFVHASSDLVTSVAPDMELQTPSVLDSLETIGAKVWSVFGLPGSTIAKRELPPGLSGLGRNLCFLNSVLQCIARAPNLADELAEEVKSCKSQDRDKLALLDVVTETLQQLNVMPCENTISVVNTADLCQAGSHVNPDLLTDQRQNQVQQDACEFLTWLLYEIHEAVNDTKSGKERYHHDEAMSKLKTVYGNISESYTKVMKEECKAQIAKANGITDADIAEHVQNLCNLEWISHRRANRSVIDDLFTFQCIELRMCSRCRDTSANIQTMNVIPLPISDQEDCLSLSSCVNTFIAQERLFGRDGLQCMKCQMSVEEGESAPETPGVQTRRSVTRAMSSISASLSPIQREADATMHYQAAQFLSSTPLPGAAQERKSTPTLISNMPTAKVITEGIRQCLLRRLPECLTIQMLRFNYDSFTKKVRKIHSPVSVPLHNLDLSLVTYDSVVEREDMTGISKTHLYSLYAMSIHIGGDSTNSGHYLAFCKAVDGRWYKFDDEHVTKVISIEAELQLPQIRENCYLLFYRKQHEASS